jgi:hypothetical protein
LQKAVQGNTSKKLISSSPCGEFKRDLFNMKGQK